MKILVAAVFLASSLLFAQRSAAWSIAVETPYDTQSSNSGNASTPTQCSAHAADLDRLKAGIVRGDPESMKQAAYKDDQEMMPYLREQLKGPDKHRGSPAYTASMALAKMGDRDQIKQIACDLLGDDQSQLDALYKLSWVGGYSSISLLHNLLFPTPENEKIIDRITLRQRATVVLGEILPTLSVSPGVKIGIPPTEEQYREWRGWLSQHKAELINLLPSEQVVGESSECLGTKAFQSPKLEFFLRSSKRNYAPGEPIFLILEIRNRDNVSAQVPFGCCEQHITVSGPGLPDPSLRNRDSNETEIQVCTCPVVFTKVLPGKKYRERLLLNKPTGDEWFSGRLLVEHYALKHSGTYKVKIAREVGGQDSAGGGLYAELDVNVIEATSK